MTNKYPIYIWERSFGKPPSDWNYQLLSWGLNERNERKVNQDLRKIERK
jgi:hypothetical protein